MTAACKYMPDLQSTIPDVQNRNGAALADFSINDKQGRALPSDESDCNMQSVRKTHLTSTHIFSELFFLSCIYFFINLLL